MSASNAAFYILPAEQQFNGNNWTEFKTKILTAAKAKGLTGYLEGTIKQPTPSPGEPEVATTYWGSKTPTSEEWVQRDGYAQGMVTLNVINLVGHGVKLNGTAAETWTSLTVRKDARSDQGQMKAEAALAKLEYSVGANIEDHFAALRTAWTRANDQGAGITDAKFRMFVLKSMPDAWDIMVGTLMDLTTSEAVMIRLGNYATLTDRSSNVAPAQSTHALSVQTHNGRRPLRNPHEMCSNPGCGRAGHTIERCFKPGGGMAGQYPDWWKKSGSVANTNAPTTNLPPRVPPSANSVMAANNSVSFDQRLAFSVITEPRTHHLAPLITYADSAASEHFFASREDFETYGPVAEGGAGAGTTANGGEFFIQGTGRVRKVIMYDGKLNELTFENALHAPNLTHNLLSIGCLDRKGCSVLFGRGSATFYNPGGIPFMRGEAHNTTMYRLDFVTTPAALSARSNTRPTDIETWHRRLGHVGESILQTMIRGNLVEGLDVTKKTTHGRCEDCIMGKHARRPFDEVVIPESRVNERACFDLWGPARVPTTSGKTYMMLGADQGGAGVKGYFLSDKTMATTAEVLANYHVESERQTGNQLLYIRTDEGKEFINSLWKAYCEKFGIIHETTAPYSSSANGVAERGNRTVLDRGRSMMIDAGIPAHYWGEAMATAIYLMQFIPSSRHPGMTPYEITLGKKPDISYLRPFGCRAYAKVPEELGGSKLDPRSVKCVLVGYFGRGDYKLLDRTSGRIFRSRDVIFEEGFSHRTLSAAEGPSVAGENPELDDFLPPDIPPAGPVAVAAPAQPELNVPRRSGRIRIPTTAAREAEETEDRIREGAAQGLDWAHDDEALSNSAIATHSGRLDNTRVPLAFATIPENNVHWVPRSYSEAMTQPELWKEPMDKEIGRMHERKVWTLVERPKGARTMKNQWTFANKYNENGDIVSRKARLVAKGFSQIPGVDFFASYASVVRYESLRINLALGTVNNMELWQVDYTSAYLNSPNQVPMLMEQPEGYEVKPSDVYEVLPGAGVRVEDNEKDDDERSLVALVDKAIYGTMDGAYNWWKTLDTEMGRIGYKRSRADQSVRSRVVKEEQTITSTYTDDVTGMSSTIEGAAKAKQELGQKYDLKDLGELKLVLGIRVDRDRSIGLLTLSQEEYLKRVLERHGMSNCSPKYTPLPPGIILTKSQSPTTAEEHNYMKDKPYREVLGAVMYAQIATRPDLSFAVASLSRFSSDPGKAHWQALMHVLQYIKATLHYKLRYGGVGYNSFTPYGYVDSDYAADTDTRRSVSGHVFLQAGGPSAWGSKYQATVAMSTTEAEYMAISRAVQQLQWMFSSLAEIGFPQARPAKLYADNAGAISLTENTKGNARIKHIDIRHHYVRDRVEDGDISITFVPSTDNLADLFTKPLPRPAHHKFCVALRLCEE
ncbi:Retrovirus-related Pol polyprotein from transposon TNT 1-94 [Hypsizygus marmoreus]|uniref:Retrovirus-related Pol polyprotein from transposon TNT 1-94 n=1 Tax=Hypsizygus marmoreus TaxID=39966 RepID=A0A369JT07_HYPMA|nr:Retrovirus-related Pol polyprotein from transposon TNT 1-94 [Hypsizygus marmoreus]